MNETNIFSQFFWDLAYLGMNTEVLPGKISMVLSICYGNSDKKEKVMFGLK